VTAARRTPQERHAYRAFLRAHHPDLGGDPSAFVEGLARWRDPVPPPAPVSTDRPFVHHRRRGPGVLLDWFLETRRRRRRPSRVQ
jgi:hypothetical protein